MGGVSPPINTGQNINAGVNVGVLPQRSEELATQVPFTDIYGIVAAIVNGQQPLSDNGGFAYDAAAFSLVPTGTKFTNLTFTAASTTVTDPNGGFTAAMSGQMLVLPFGGRVTASAIHGGCGPTFTYTSPTTGTLSFAPAFSGTGQLGWMVPDNTNAINAAILAVSLKNNGRGGILRLPTGIYGVGQLVEQSNVTIQGAGWDRTILVDRALTSKLFWSPGEQSGGIGRVSNCSVLDVTIEGSRSNFLEGGPSRVDSGNWRIATNNLGYAGFHVFHSTIDFLVRVTNVRATVTFSGSWQRTGGTGVYLEQGSSGCHGVGWADHCEGGGLALDAGHGALGNAQTTAAACVGNDVVVFGTDVGTMSGTRFAEDGTTLALMVSQSSGLSLEGAQHNTIRTNFDRVGSQLLAIAGETGGTSNLVLVTSDQSGSLNINLGNTVDAWGRDVDSNAVADQGGQSNTIRAVARNICRRAASTSAVVLSPSTGADATNNPGALNFDTLDEDIEVDIQQDAGVGTNYANPLALGGGASTQVVKRSRVHGRLGPYTGALLALSGTAANRPTQGADRNWIEPARGDMAKFTTVTPVGAGSIAQTDADPVLLVDATAGAQTVTWPTAVGRDGMCLATVKIDASANAVTVDPAGAETINGAATLALAARWDRCRAMSDGAQWVRLG